MINRLYLVIIAFLLTPLFSDQENSELDVYFDLYNKIFTTFNSNYVDTLDKTKLIKGSFDGMFSSVDPYTKLYIGSSKDNLEILTKGKYGGIGMQIGLIKDTLTVISCYEDSPSYFEGIQPGDQILMVDSVSIIGLSSAKSSEMIRGELGTKVALTIKRPYLNENIIFNLERANIVVKDVPYWNVDNDGVGYIRIKKFSKNTAKDFRKAFNQILNNSAKGLIIDLRGNTGGLLSNALNILDQLVPKGERILETKGRIDKSNRLFDAKFPTKIEVNFPIVVLINRSSASASEIVAGTLQDLDLAVILGQPSFGKGLVQRIFNINDTISLKVTTSKYYTPSGRLIQKMNYLDNDVLTDGLEDRDSIFYTKNGRAVKGGGGITPDIEMVKESVPLLIQALYRDRVFLKFVSIYAYENAIELPITINKKIINDFIVYAKKNDIDYLLPGESELEELKNEIYEEYTINKTEEIISDKILRPDENYVIVDAERWLKIKNGSGKTVRIIPPEKHEFNSGEYYYTELGEIIPKIGFNESKKEELNYLTNNISNYFNEIKLFQYNDSNNLKWIENGLLREFSSFLGGEEEKIKASLVNDNEYLKAVEIILDKKLYSQYINP